MRINAFADEFSARAQDEIALYLFPHVVKFILRRPHIRARRFDGVTQVVCVIDHRTRRSDCAYVLMVFKDADGLLSIAIAGQKSCQPEIKVGKACKRNGLIQLKAFYFSLPGFGRGGFFMPCK